jgi:hypothetical protein
MTVVFFSYSHVDEKLRDRLELALTMLKREGAIQSFHDRRIEAGMDLDGKIFGELERADVILVLVSPDFLASNYCYDRELMRALERYREGSARLIPIVLRPCEWQRSPLAGIMALPTDGKPVTKFADLDDAFLDISMGIRAAIDGITATRLPAAFDGPEASRAAPTARKSDPDVAVAGRSGPNGGEVLSPRSSNLRLKQTFTDADRDKFKLDAFEFIKLFFENSLTELTRRNDGVQSTFRPVDANQFTATVYRDGKKVGFARIFMGHDAMTRGIAYAGSESMGGGGFNELLTVETSDDGLFLKALGMASPGRTSASRLTFEGGAELYWSLLMERQR